MPEIAGKQVGAIGFGLMGLTTRDPPVPKEQAIQALRAAVESGCTFWNAAEHYGTPSWNTQTLMAAYFDRYPEDADKVVISVKGGFDFHRMTPDASPASLKRSIETILMDLGGKKKTIDVFECARVDPTTPLEETLRFLDEEYVQKGVIGGIALSEVGEVTLRKAAAITRIVGVEVELSLWSTHVLENGVAAACGELGIPLISYSPLGQGMLTGQVKTLDDIPATDHRRMYPRFQPEAFDVNIQLAREIHRLAAEKGCAPGQLALAWVRSIAGRPGMPSTVIPIPGATSEARVRENARSGEIELTPEELVAINSVLAKFPVVGRRYPEGWPMDG
ncbi:NADP-dependent oxidoreductase domain-containing protein [Xylariales sp. PMI_506]|nr:NADP-dependent oxidoreductase domain-containing protein [Xylariales sp. PMI_506]